jgi:hypothetical protein
MSNECANLTNSIVVAAKIKCPCRVCTFGYQYKGSNVCVYEYDACEDSPGRENHAPLNQTSVPCGNAIHTKSGDHLITIGFLRGRSPADSRPKPSLRETNDHQGVEIEVSNGQINTRRLHKQWSDNFIISNVCSFGRPRNFQNDDQLRGIAAIRMKLHKPVGDPCKFAKCIKITPLVIQSLQTIVPKENREF